MNAPERAAEYEIRDVREQNAALRERLRVAEEQRDVWAQQATNNESRRWSLEQRLKLVKAIEYTYSPEAGCRCHPMQSGVEPCEYHSGYIDALEAVGAVTEACLGDPCETTAPGPGHVYACPLYRRASSSDDATLAEAERWAKHGKHPALITHDVLAVIAIARRLQDDVRELQEQLNECPNCCARNGRHLYGCQAR